MKESLISVELLKRNMPHYDEEGYRIFYESEIDNAPTVELDESVIQEVLNKRCMTAVANEYLVALHGKRPQGKWINREAVSNTTFPFWERYECNKCHKYNGYSNFCPNCGSDMRRNGL